MARTIRLVRGYTNSGSKTVRMLQRSQASRLTLCMVLLLIAPFARAQDSGLGIDLQFGNALDPSGLEPSSGIGTLGCDPDGASWLTSVRKRTPTGFLYACPPDHPEFLLGGEWQYRGAFSVGYLGLSGDQDNMLFSRYSNWDDGLYLGGSFRYEKPSDGSYFDVRASRINDDDQYLRALYGRAGKYRIQAFVRSQSNVTSSNARSIWEGIGSNNLTLNGALTPASSTSAQVAAVSASQPEQSLVVVRDKQGLGINYFISPRWVAFGNISHESRAGARPFGGPFFFNYPFADNGGAYEIPRPIDDSTVNLNGGARWTGSAWRMEFAYSGSFFRHANGTFDYQVPFAVRPVVPGLVSPLLTSGQFAYEPENDYHHLRVNLTRKIALNGEFSLAASGGELSQNDQLAPPMTCTGQFGIPVIPGNLYDCANWNTSAALSRARADLAIKTSMLDARVVLQPGRDVTWRASAKYDRQDYQGDYDAFNPLTGQWGYPAENGAQGSVVPFESGIWDPGPGASNITRIRNLPLDRELLQFTLSADVRLNTSNSLGTTYSFDRTKRGNREVATTNDHSLKLTWHNRTFDWLTFRANYTYLRRTGSEYEFNPYEYTFSTSLPGFVIPPNGVPAHTVSAMRKYDVGGRTQHKADLMATFVLPSDMTFYASVRGDWNDYSAVIGRRGYDALGGSLQWEWQPTTATVASVWYGFDRSSLDLANVNDAALTPDPVLGGATYPEANRWWSRDRQRNHYAGLTLNQTVGRIKLDANWNWSSSRGRTSYSFNSPGALTTPALAALLTGQFPDMLYRAHAVSLGVAIPVNRSFSVRVFDRYERGRVSDWHYLGFENGQVLDHRVYTDGGPTDYSANLIGLAFEVKL